MIRKRKNLQRRDQKTDSLPGADISVRGVFSDQYTMHLDSVYIPKILSAYPQLGKYASLVSQFYNYRNYRYAWYDSLGIVEQANNLYTHISEMENEGILEKPPYLKILDSLINDPMVKDKPDSVAGSPAYS